MDTLLLFLTVVTIFGLLLVPNFIFVFFRARTLGGAVADGLTPARVAASWAQAFRRFVGILFAELAMLEQFSK